MTVTHPGSLLELALPGDNRDAAEASLELNGHKALKERGD